MNVPGEENLERNSRVERPRPPVAPVTTICILGLRFRVFPYEKLGIHQVYISRNRLSACIRRAVKPGNRFPGCGSALEFRESGV